MPAVQPDLKPTKSTRGSPASPAKKAAAKNTTSSSAKTTGSSPAEARAVRVVGVKTDGSITMEIQVKPASKSTPPQVMVRTFKKATPATQTAQAKRATQPLQAINSTPVQLFEKSPEELKQMMAELRARVQEQTIQAVRFSMEQLHGTRSPAKPPAAKKALTREQRIEQLKKAGLLTASGELPPSYR